MPGIPFSPNWPDLEAVRQIIFERLRREPHWDQLDPTGEGYGPYVEYVGPQPSARHALVFSAEEVFWQLIIERVLAPGMNPSNLKLPFFHVTAYGREVLKSGPGNPHDPTGYLRRLGEKLPHADPTVMTYLLLDYVRHQLDQVPKPTPQTVNHRLAVLRCLYRFQFGCEIPAGQTHFHRIYTTRSSLGYGRSRRAVAAGLRLRQPRHIILPLSAEEVAKFWTSFRTFRDLALVGLMLLDGLRSCEVLAVQLEDLQLTEAQIWVLGKRSKRRLLPLPGELVQVLQSYLRLERPLTNTPYLFVSLKGRQRGCPMTIAGPRSLFRHHRLRSRIPHANPHRLRHTFGADMVRAGISLPALQHLMGHAHIHTTMLYVQLAPEDVWREYARAVQNRTRLGLPQNP